jgi:tetratricopeptide (TPR) repeat protein
MEMDAMGGGTAKATKADIANCEDKAPQAKRIKEEVAEAAAERMDLDNGGEEENMTNNDIKEEPVEESNEPSNSKDNGGGGGGAAAVVNAVKENCVLSPSASATPTSTTESEASKPSTSSCATASTAVVASSSSPSTSQSTSSPPPPSTTSGLEKQPEKAASTVTVVNSLTLSSLELEVMSELNSAAFGHVKLNEDKNARKKKVALKAVSYMEQVIATRHSRKRKWPSAEREGKKLSNNNDKKASLKEDNAAVLPSVNPKVYSKLGHLHLLLEDYPKALSAYRKYNLLAAEEARCDVPYLYGQGLVYFHFNAYHWATRSFQQALYVQPSFERANEIHARLGIMAKINGDFSASLKHFQLAKKCYESSVELRQSLLSEDEIQFHIAHLHEINGKHATAINMYKEVLSRRGDAGLPNALKADIHRQLGWTYYSVESLGDKQNRFGWYSIFLRCA